MQGKVQISRGKVGLGFVWPFDKTDAVAREVFVKSGLQILFWLIEAIKIKVIEVYPGNWVNFNQGVGWAFHWPGFTTSTQQCAHKSGFASAQVALQPDHSTSGER